MSAAVVWSGGKDSALALDRACAAGHDIMVLLNFHDRDSGRVRFHGVRRELIARQAAALGVELVQLASGPADFEQVFTAGLHELRRRGIRDVIFGNIHLADVRAWYEERTTTAGFAHHEPLWSTAPQDVVHDFLDRGWRAIITGIDTARLPLTLLGREFDDGLLRELTHAEGVDPAGEHGEFHTFVYDGPRFRASIGITRGDIHETATHALLDLLLA